ncbi:MAG: hypothetical protein WAO15_10825 [Mycobacterium sp.]
MTTTGRCSRRRALSVWAAGAALVVAMFGHAVLSAPQASANCTMTAQDDQYIHLLAQNKMVHTADFDDCNMSAEGRWFANQVRTSADPYVTAKNLVKMVDDTTPMDAKQAEWEVESAIYVYAPQVIPKIKDEAAQQTPA